MLAKPTSLSCEINYSFVSSAVGPDESATVSLQAASCAPYFGRLGLHLLMMRILAMAVVPLVQLYQGLTSYMLTKKSPIIHKYSVLHLTFCLIRHSCYKAAGD